MNYYRVLVRMMCGVKNIWSNKRNRIIGGVFVTLLLVLWINRFYILQTENEAIANVDMCCIILLVTVGVLYLMSEPLLEKYYSDNLRRIALVNHLSETPIFLRKIKDISNGYTLVFESYGIPIEKWLDKQQEIENVLNIVIEQIEQGENKRVIMVYASNGNFSFPLVMKYSGKYKETSDDVIILGKSAFGDVEISLKVYPHILIGGSTGSGKSVLLKFMLVQCVKKDFEVYIADFKGGVDYPHWWHKNSHLIFDVSAVISHLQRMVYLLEERKTILRENNCANIDLFNAVAEQKMKRYIFACDELAELLDKTGLDKADKEQVTKVESYLSTIARQGRAFGIHLILATQRPDANILPGQIKNNIDCRICGRADNVLSQIILDNTDAASKISKRSQGIFLNQEGVLFKGYLFDEE